MVHTVWTTVLKYKSTKLPGIPLSPHNPSIKTYICMYKVCCCPTPTAMAMHTMPMVGFISYSTFENPQQ